MIKTSRLFAALTIAGLAGSAQASVVLFADTFDRPDNTDLNASTAGQSGTVSPLSWSERSNGGNSDPVIRNNTLAIGEDGAGGGWSIAYPEYNFIDSLITTGGEFTVSVDISGIATTGNTRFNGFALGQSQSEVSSWSTNVPSNFASDFFFGLDTTGGGPTGFYTYENGTEKLINASVPAGGVAALSVRFTGVTDFNAGTSVSYEAFIDGNSAGTGTFTWSGTNENYIALYSNYNSVVNVADNTALHDNFTVSAVPEPGSLALLGLAGLLVARRRRG